MSLFGTPLDGGLADDQPCMGFLAGVLSGARHLLHDTGGRQPNADGPAAADCLSPLHDLRKSPEAQR